MTSLLFQYGGINVVCQPLESAVTVVLQDYKPGFASVRLINYTRHGSIEYVQRYSSISSTAWGRGTGWR